MLRSIITSIAIFLFSASVYSQINGGEAGCYCYWFWGPNAQTGEIGRQASIKINEPGKGFIVNSAETDVSPWGGPWYGLSRGTFDLSYQSFDDPVLLQGFFGIGLKTWKGSLTVNQNGAVTIGMSDAEIQANAQLSNVPFKLYVKGGIRSNEVLVDVAGNWPDYVFHDHYKLTPLEDLKKFIDENKHLPNLPTASCVKEDGVNLGEMDAKLLEKIEELTLYVIRLNEEIEMLKAQVND